MRPPNGAADPVKPSHELLGEVLLETGNPAEAAKAFEASLLRMPNRARSLLGSARAHAAAGDRATASERFQKLVEIRGSHTELAGYQEAQRYLSSTDDGALRTKASCSRRSRPSSRLAGMLRLFHRVEARCFESSTIWPT